jgi:hypothetical protein
MTDAIFGPSIGDPQVEAAVLDTLRTWLPTYLWRTERANGLLRGTIPHPPTPESYRGGLDFLDWQQDECPTVIVVVNPVHEPERAGSIGYSQWFETQIGAVIVHDDPDITRLLTGYYGVAIQQAILQNGALGGIASRTIMTASPKLEYQDPDQRIDLQAAATFEVMVSPTVTDQGGPDVPEPGDSPQYGGSPDAPYTDWPTVETTDATVTAEPITEQ